MDGSIFVYLFVAVLLLWRAVELYKKYTSWPYKGPTTFKVSYSLRVFDPAGKSYPASVAMTARVADKGKVARYGYTLEENQEVVCDFAYGVICMALRRQPLAIGQAINTDGLKVELSRKIAYRGLCVDEMSITLG